MLNITNDGRKLAYDQKFDNFFLLDFEDSMVNACIGNIYDIWKDTEDKRTTQLVFCDFFIINSKGLSYLQRCVRARCVSCSLMSRR